ncbi:MAG: aminoacyl-tRNA hydrolase [Puia sp.]
MGSEYEGTRHNIGFEVVDMLVSKQGGKFVTDRLASIAEISFRGKTLTCIKPTTYMNLSGKAVKYWLEKKEDSDGTHARGYRRYCPSVIPVAFKGKWDRCGT